MPESIPPNTGFRLKVDGAIAHVAPRHQGVI
jgi:hypothetical protein